MFKVMIFSFVLAFAGVSAAEAAFSCKKPDELNDSVQDCAGNQKYVEAGRACALGFQAYLQAERELALTQLSAVQAGGFVGEEGHAKAVRTLTKVLEAGELASGAVKGYLANIVYPEDWDAPREVIGNVNDFFNSHKCYRDSRDGLEALAEEIDTSVKQIVESLAARPPTAAKARKH